MHRVHYPLQHFGGNIAHQAAHHIGRKGVSAAGDCLVHDAEGVAHGAIAGFGQHGQRVLVDGEVFGLADLAQVVDDLVKAYRVKAEVLAAGANRLRNVLGLGGRHHEDDPRGRLFQGLQQRVEGCIGYLVSFVEDKDAVAVASRFGGGRGNQAAHFLDAAIGGRIDFDHVHGAHRAIADLAAGVAHATGFGHRAVAGLAIQGHGQNAGDGGFSNSAMPAENVTVSDALLLQRILQSMDDVVLSDHIGELLGTVFARQNGITHGRIHYNRRTYRQRTKGYRVALNVAKPEGGS